MLGRPSLWWLTVLVLATLALLVWGLWWRTIRRSRARHVHAAPFEPTQNDSPLRANRPRTAAQAVTVPSRLDQVSRVALPKKRQIVGDEDDAGESLYEDVPPLHTPASAEASRRATGLMPDFASSTLPMPLADLESGSWASSVNLQHQVRIQEALQALSDGPVDRAWDTLRGFFPDAAHRETALETFDRIALAFERHSRPAQACDVYRHMAEIDPNWHQVKERLLRAQQLSTSTQTRVAPSQRALPSTRRLSIRTPAQPAMQRQLGPYRVERQIGQGAMGAVYLGHDANTDRQVALKTMALSREFQGAELADARHRFLREADMAGHLKHPDIVSIIDTGEQDGVAYIAMELVSGVDLSHHAHPSRLLPVTPLLLVIARVADALAYAHSRGVTHRDIKPANIMVDLRRGSVKVMDFGVARVADATRTRTGVVVGTPTFMSPEQLSGQPIDGRSDLYSLGVSLFQLLTGQLPYRNDSMSALMRAIGQGEVPNVCSIRPELPAALGDIVALALQKHPTTRYATGQQMAEDLRAVAALMQQLDIDVG